MGKNDIKKLAPVPTPRPETKPKINIKTASFTDEFCRQPWSDDTADQWSESLACCCDDEWYCIGMVPTLIDAKKEISELAKLTDIFGPLTLGYRKAIGGDKTYYRIYGLRK